MDFSNSFIPHHRPYLICLFGLPASGKSTLLQKIRDNLHSPKTVRLVTINTDDLIPLQNQITISKEAGLWKKVRKSILVAAENFISQVLNPHSCDDELENDEVQRFISLIRDKNSCDSVSHDDALVIICEDNLYYRSMRHEWSKIASKLDLIFGGIFMDTDLSLCLERNSLRNCDFVEDSIIIQMSEVQERPSNSEFSSNLLIVKNNQIDAADILSKVLHFRQPVASKTVVSEEIRTRDREQAITNFLHRLDCLSRDVIKEEIERSNVADRTCLGPKLSKAKRQFLLSVKHSNQIIPTVIADDILSVKPSANVKAFVRDALLKYV